MKYLFYLRRILCEEICTIVTIVSRILDLACSANANLVHQLAHHLSTNEPFKLKAAKELALKLIDDDDTESGLPVEAEPEEQDPALDYEVMWQTLHLFFLEGAGDPRVEEILDFWSDIAYAGLRVPRGAAQPAKPPVKATKGPSRDTNFMAKFAARAPKTPANAAPASDSTPPISADESTPAAASTTPPGSTVIRAPIASSASRARPQAQTAQQEAAPAPPSRATSLAPSAASQTTSVRRLSPVAAPPVEIDSDQDEEPIAGTLRSLTLADQPALGQAVQPTKPTKPKPRARKPKDTPPAAQLESEAPQPVAAVRLRRNPKPVQR